MKERKKGERGREGKNERKKGRKGEREEKMEKEKRLLRNKICPLPRKEAHEKQKTIEPKKKAKGAR